MNFDAECNETTPAISFDRFHKYFDMFTKITQMPSQNCFLDNINRQVRKETRTDMEKETFV